MIFTQVIEGGRRSRFSIMFFGNPPLVIREFMHANGFRWRSGFWYRRSIAGAAEFIQQLNRVLHPERSGRPVPAVPKSGRVPTAARRRLLDSLREELNPDPVDRLYEDNCARVCGPSGSG